MKFAPIFAYCALERERLKSTSGMIIIPQGVDKRNAKNYGVLLSVGDKAEDFVKGLIGKRVLSKEHAGSWVKLGDDELFVCHEEDILGEVQG